MECSYPPLWNSDTSGQDMVVQSEDHKDLLYKLILRYSLIRKMKLPMPCIVSSCHLLQPTQIASPYGAHAGFDRASPVCPFLAQTGHAHAQANPTVPRISELCMKVAYAGLPLQIPYTMGLDRAR